MCTVQHLNVTFCMIMHVKGLEYIYATFLWQIHYDIVFTNPTKKSDSLFPDPMI
jgi:hypothetical protein